MQNLTAILERRMSNTHFKYGPAIHFMTDHAKKELLEINQKYVDPLK